MKTKLATFSLLIFAGSLLADENSSKPSQGIRDKRPSVHALTNARVITKPGSSIEKGTVVIREGKIEAVGSNVRVPDDARVWDMAGKTIYPGFVDAMTHLGLPEDAKPSSDGSGVPHWNKQVVPQFRVVDHLKSAGEKTKTHRDLGFVAAHVVPRNGIFRGTGAVISLGEGPINQQIISGETLQAVAFELSGGKKRTYPNSLMGCIALIRQTLMDAKWYRASQVAYSRNLPGVKRPEANVALAALEPVSSGKRKLLVKCQDELDFNRALRIGNELQLKMQLLGNGYEYRKIEALKAAGSLIVPINFPEVPAVEYPSEAVDLSLARLQHWEAAPSNAAILEESGLRFSISTNQLEKPKDVFWKNLRLAVKRGLSAEGALKALTLTPAATLGIESQLGSLESGKLASLIVADGDLFQDDESKIHQVWVDGECFESEIADQIDPTGKWEITWSGVEGPKEISIGGKWGGFSIVGEKGAGIEKKEGADKDDEKEESKGKGAKVPVQVAGDQINFVTPKGFFDPDMPNARISGYLHGIKLTGIGELSGGSRFTWSARRIGDVEEEANNEDDKKKQEPEEKVVVALDKYPYGAFPGQVSSSRTVLIRGATVWTCGPDGKIEDADVLVAKGKIADVGKGLVAPEAALEIDGKGKHITPGLIDCHSHTAISRGVNEGTHAVTVEVRIGDVLDPTDINIYRQLAGGLTTANLLHGSANPMGGQNQVVKLRWGSDAESLKFKGAKPGVKFALGENVKQSNWGSDYTTRYPQTRMGVEQIMKDTFIAAREYQASGKKNRLTHRRNLRLESALEILEGERIVHIHSYRQDEILMFVRLAQEFGFTVGTFQHVLEGYKVADAIAEINAGGSTFSDWWAYKFEVYDAIPYNGAIMTEAGVITSFNSDDSELARRMNTEAAKAVKYGGVSEEEALKFVTINPAKQLRIQNKVGSLERGKDADFVIWNGHPLSNYSMAEQTWIDGRLYFDLGEDLKLRQEAAKERQRLVAKALPLRVKSLASRDDGKESGDADNEKPANRIRQRFRSLWDEYDTINYQEIYHNGQSLHTCTGCLCEGQ